MLVECKLGLPTKLSANFIAQLLLETVYLQCRKRTELLFVLTDDDNVWRFFQVVLTCGALEFKSYLLVTEAEENINLVSDIRAMMLDITLAHCSSQF